MLAADFLAHEARLLDERRLNEWLELFTSDAIYWVPSGRDDINPNRHVSIIYDDRARITERVRRLQGGHAHSQDPPSRTCHILGHVTEVGREGAQVILSTNFMIVEYRRATQSLYAGRYEHRLVQTEAGWRITLKKVELLNNDDSQGNLTFLL